MGNSRVAFADGLEEALVILRSWKADAEEYPSWAWQYREKVYRAIDTLERVSGDLSRDKEQARE